MKRLTLFVLLALTFGAVAQPPTPQRKIRWQDLSKAVQDSIVNAAAVSNVDSVTVVLAGGDTIAVDTTGNWMLVNANTRSLANQTKVDSLNSLVSLSYNFYDRQDASVNSALQMHVRWAHYWFDKYYTDTDTTLTYEYDGSGAEYIGERRQLGTYIKLLKVLHNLTGDTRYWNLMVELVNKMDGTREKIAESGGGAGSDTALTYNLHSGTDWDQWAHDDCKMYRTKYYMYQQDPVTYASYLTEIKSFLNVAISYMDSSASYPGWGWGYTWNTQRSATASERIVNTNTPFLPLFATMRANNITLSERVTAVADWDTLIDSVYAYVDGIWFTTTTDTAGGWGYDYADASPETNYNYVVAQDLWETAEILSDTAYADSLMHRLRLVTNYQLERTGANYNELSTYYTPRQTSLIKWAEKYNLTLVNDSLRQSYVANYLNPPGYAGGFWGLTTGGNNRRVTGHELAGLVTLVEYFNNNSFSETWNHYSRRDGTDFTKWATNQTAYYTSDGQYFYQKYITGVSGVGQGAQLRVGYRHNDSTPAGGDPDTATISSNNVLTWRVPQSGTVSTGRYYTIKHRYGTPYFKVVPDSADSVYIYVDDPGDQFGDSLYFFYYNTAGVLDTLKNTTLGLGETRTVDLTKGLYIQNCETSGNIKGYQGLVFFGNKSAATMTAGADDGTTKIYSFVTTGEKPDSIMAGVIYHIQSGFFLSNPVATGWQYPKAAARDILTYARKHWQNFVYDGILEDKTQ